MKSTCIKYYQFGDPIEVLKVESRSIQSLAPHEVLVSMIASPINPSDLIPVRGAYAHRIKLPAIPGYEGVGIVQEVGTAVPQSLIGQRVLPLRGEGTWQSLVKTAAEWIVPVPDTISDETACQLYINPVTAWLVCTEVLRLKPGDTLIVNACGSSIGRIFIQLANILGFRLIGVIRNDTYKEDLLKLGAAAVINISQTALRDVLREITNGRGATAAVDSIGGVDGSKLAYCVRPGGTILSIGLLSGIAVNWAEVSKHTGVTASLFHLRHWLQRVSRQSWQETFNRLLKLVENKQLKLIKPAAQFNLCSIQTAVRMAESYRSMGKVLLTADVSQRK